MSAEHVRVWGDPDGSPVVLVHGSGSSGRVFEPIFQVPGYRFVAPDRHGYGDRPPVDHVDFEEDAWEVADLLGSGAHLVGSSYGGIVALLAAARRPEAVKSLAVNEPPAFGLVRGISAADALAHRLQGVYERMRRATPEEFNEAFDAALGFPHSPAGPMDEPTRKNIRAMMAERFPGEARIPLDRLAAAPFPKLVISGGWSEVFDGICDALVRGIRADRAVFPGTGHGLIGKGKPVIDRLAALWASAE